MKDLLYMMSFFMTKKKYRMEVHVHYAFRSVKTITIKDPSP